MKLAKPILASGSRLVGDRLRDGLFDLRVRSRRWDGRFQYVLDPNPLDGEGSIGRYKVSDCFCVKFYVKEKKNSFVVDFSAVFVVLSLKQCRN